MKVSSLYLEQYTFSEFSVSIEMNGGPQKGACVLSAEDLDMELESFSVHKTDSLGGPMATRLKIFVNEKELHDKNYYKFSIEAYMTLRFHDDSFKTRFSNEDAESMLVRNAANLMYGAMREKLMSATSGMLLGPVMLPLVTFNSIEIIEKNDAEENKEAVVSDRNKKPKSKTKLRKKTK